MAKAIAISVGVLALVAALAAGVAWITLSNLTGTSPVGGLHGPAVYDECDPGGRLTRPMLTDRAVRLEVAAARRSGVLVTAPHEMSFEPACASGSITVTYSGDLEQAYVELAPQVLSGGWVPTRWPVAPIPTDVKRQAAYSKQVDGVYYLLQLRETTGSRFTQPSTAIVVSIPDAHAIDRYRPVAQ